MHIAIDGTARLHGGGALHLRELLSAWSRSGLLQEHTISVFCREENAEVMRGWISASSRGTSANPIEIRSVIKSGASNFARLKWQQLTLPRIASAEKYDVVFCPGNISPLFCKVPTVVVFQNAAPFCSAITVGSEGFVRWVSFSILGILMRLSCKTATRTIFISHYFMDLFLSMGYCSSNRSDVIYLGREAIQEVLGTNPIHDRMEGYQTCVLSVGHLYPYKRFSNLVRGYGSRKSELIDAGVRLCLVGKAVNDAEYAKIASEVKALGLQDWVEVCGPVPPEWVGPLMRLASIFVFQSTCENCPSTLIEALSSGTPILCSEMGVMPEIVEEAALYYDPLVPTDIGAGLVRLVHDQRLREVLSQRGLEQCRKFPSWEEVSIMTLNSLEAAAKAVKHG